MSTIKCDINALDGVDIALRVAVEARKDIPAEVFRDDDGSFNFSKASEDEVFGDAFSRIIAQKIQQYVYERMTSPNEKHSVVLEGMTENILRHLEKCMPDATVVST